MPDRSKDERQVRPSVTEVWEAFTSFCEAVMLAREVAERERERLATNSHLHRRRRRRPVRLTPNDDLRPP